MGGDIHLIGCHCRPKDLQQKDRAGPAQELPFAPGHQWLSTSDALLTIASMVSNTSKPACTAASQSMQRLFHVWWPGRAAAHADPAMLQC